MLGIDPMCLFQYFQHWLEQQSDWATNNESNAHPDSSLPTRRKAPSSGGGTSEDIPSQRTNASRLFSKF